MKACTSLSDQIHINLLNQVGIEFESYIVQTILSQFEIEKYKIIIIYPNLRRRTRPRRGGIEGPGRRKAEGWSSAPSAVEAMLSAMASMFVASMTTVGTAAVLVFFISDGSAEGWIGGFAARLQVMASMFVASMTTVGTAAVLVFFIINGSEKRNESETERDISNISEA